MFLLILPSYASSWVVPGTAATVGEALLNIEREGGDGDIEIAAGYLGDEGPVTISNLTVRFTTSEYGAYLPPMRIDNGAEVEAANFTIAGNGGVALPESLPDFTDLGAIACRLCVVGGTFTGTNVSMSGGDGTGGIVLLDGEVNLTGGNITDFALLPAVIVGSYAGSAPTLNLTTAYFSNNGRAVDARGEGVTVKSASSYFQTNFGACSDLHLEGAEATVSDTWFDRSLASVDPFGDGSAPVCVSEASFSCTRCTFNRTRGLEANTIYADLRDDNILTLTENAFSDPLSGITILASGGTLNLQDFNVAYAGLSAPSFLLRYGGITALDGGVMSGWSSGVSAAFYLASTETVANDITVCDWFGTSVFETSGGSLTVDRLIMQNVAATQGFLGDSFVPTDLALRDSTMVGMSGSIVSGELNSLDLRNNVIKGVGAGLSLNAWPQAAEYGHNLWYEVSTASTGSLPSDFHDTDLVDVYPDFVGTYDYANCTTRPELAWYSPARDAGDPALSQFGEAPDIGALDFPRDLRDTGDTGTIIDTGDSGIPYGVDADADGWFAAEDCNDADPTTHPAATDDPTDDIDQDCDGFAARLAVGGGCGCATGAPAPTWILLPALLLRRRRLG